MVGSVKYVGFDKSYAQVEIGLKSKIQYEVIEKEGDLNWFFQSCRSFAVAISNTYAYTDSDTDTYLYADTDAVADSNSDSDPVQVVKDGSLSIAYNVASTYSKVILGIQNYKNYNVNRISDPDRIVIDINGGKC